MIGDEVVIRLSRDEAEMLREILTHKPGLSLERRQQHLPVGRKVLVQIDKETQ